MLRARFNFKPPVQYVRWCHTNSFPSLTPNQLSKFKYLGNVGLTHFRTRDFSWYEIDLLKRLMGGSSNYSSAPLSIEDAIAQLDAFKRLPVNALSKQQLDLLDELYPYGLRREHLDLTRITPTDVVRELDAISKHDRYMELLNIISIFDAAGSTAEFFYTGDWVEFFKRAFKHHVMRRVIGFDVYEYNYAPFFAEISRNPVLFKEAVENTLSEIAGMSRRELALFSYGIEKKELSNIGDDLDSYYRARKRLQSKRRKIEKAFATTEDSSSPTL